MGILRKASPLLTTLLLSTSAVADFMLRDILYFDDRAFVYHSQEGPEVHRQWHYFPASQSPDFWRERITVHHFPRLDRPREMVMEVLTRLRQTYPDFYYGILPGAEADRAGLFFTRPGRPTESFHLFSYFRQPQVSGLVAVEYTRQPSPPGLDRSGQPPPALTRRFDQLLAGGVVQDDTRPIARRQAATNALAVRVFPQERVSEAVMPVSTAIPAAPEQAPLTLRTTVTAVPPPMTSPTTSRAIPMRLSPRPAPSMAPALAQIPSAPIIVPHLHPAPLRYAAPPPVVQPPLLPATGLSRMHAAQFLPPPPLVPVIRPLTIEPVINGHRVVVDPRFAKEFGTAVPKVDFAFFVPADAPNLYVEYQGDGRVELLRLSEGTGDRDLVANLRLFDQPIPAGAQEERLVWAVDFLRGQVVEESFAGTSNPRLTNLVLTKVGPQDAVLATGSFQSGGEDYLARIMLLVPEEGAGVLAFSQINRFLSGIDSGTDALENGLMARIAHSIRLLRDLPPDDITKREK